MEILKEWIWFKLCFQFSWASKIQLLNIGHFFRKGLCMRPSLIKSTSPMFTRALQSVGWDLSGICVNPAIRNPSPTWHPSIILQVLLVHVTFPCHTCGDFSRRNSHSKSQIWSTVATVVPLLVVRTSWNHPGNSSSKSLEYGRLGSMLIPWTCDMRSFWCV